MSALGSVFSGLVISPPIKLKSAQPSYAHNTDTNAIPNALPLTVPVGGGAGTEACELIRNAAPTMKTSAPYLARVVQPRKIVLHLTPRILTTAKTTMAIAAT